MYFQIFYPAISLPCPQQQWLSNYLAIYVFSNLAIMPPARVAVQLPSHLGIQQSRYHTPSYSSCRTTQLSRYLAISLSCPQLEQLFNYLAIQVFSNLAIMPPAIVAVELPSHLGIQQSRYHTPSYSGCRTTQLSRYLAISLSCLQLQWLSNYLAIQVFSNLAIMPPAIVTVKLPSYRGIQQSRYHTPSYSGCRTTQLSRYFAILLSCLQLQWLSNYLAIQVFSNLAIMPPAILTVKLPSYLGIQQSRYHAPSYSGCPTTQLSRYFAISLSCPSHLSDCIFGQCKKETAGFWPLFATKNSEVCQVPDSFFSKKLKLLQKHLFVSAEAQQYNYGKNIFLR